MNDKNFIKSKIRNSLKRIHQVAHLSGNAYRRFEVLVNMVSGILCSSSCRLNDLGRWNCKPIQD